MQSLRDILNDLNMYFLYTCCVLKSTPRKVSIVTCNCAGLATIKQSNLDTYNQYKKNSKSCNKTMQRHNTDKTSKNYQATIQ